jgi:hypothetical protein
MLHDCMLLFSYSLIVLTISFWSFADYKSFGQYLKDSVEQIIKFFESNTAVSQTIALETAAAVQVCFIFAGPLIVSFGVSSKYYPVLLELSIITAEMHGLFIFYFFFFFFFFE